jgi:16S rRNA (cytidine1402-2'-O)-methyltransferase
MPGIVYVVATPIGNLEDVTLRAIRTLRECSLVAAEDTRRTAKLLSHFGITAPTTSLHAHNERTKLPALLDRLDGGARIALVTDAGTPGISDPGSRFIAAAAARGHSVVPIPGPNAIAAALSVSGFWISEYAFRGFPPRRSNDRISWLNSVASNPQASVFFEAPHRMRTTLKDSGPIFGTRPICVCRELTKLHEEIVHGTASELLAHFSRPKGEFTIVVAPRVEASVAETVQVQPGELSAEFRQLTEIDGISRRDAVAAIATRHGIPRQEVYRSVGRQKDWV